LYEKECLVAAIDLFEVPQVMFEISIYWIFSESLSQWSGKIKNYSDTPILSSAFYIVYWHYQIINTLAYIKG